MIWNLKVCQFLFGRGRGGGGVSRPFSPFPVNHLLRWIIGTLWCRKSSGNSVEGLQRHNGVPLEHISIDILKKILLAWLRLLSLVDVNVVI